jgi:hypothetical protein
MVDRPSHKGEMEFESLKLSKINEYGTITGSSPVLNTRLVVSDFPEEWNFQNSQVAEW